MKTYTVIGLHEDTGEVLTCVQRTTDAHEATRIMAIEVQAAHTDVCIICAIEGDVVTVTPYEDSGRSAHASDLAEVDV